MDLLTELAIKHGTDKWGKHHYTPVYFEMFKNRRNDVEGVLEIGVAEGAGLRMFKEFFPNATIYGAEIDKSRFFEEDRIKVFPFDQSDFDHRELSELFMHFQSLDLVVDDGSHNPVDQLLTCFGMMPFLSKDCIYVIEDVADKKIAEYLSHKYQVSIHKVGDRYDDCLIIVRHKNG